MVGVAGLAGERGEAQQGDGRRRVGRRRGVVEDVLLAHDQLLAVVSGREQSAMVDVPEVVEHRVGDRRRLGDPDRFAGRLGEPDEGIGERGVVGGEGVVTSPWLAALVPGRAATGRRRCVVR